MRQILLFIKPEFVKSILEGTKLYEYRKSRCRDDVNKMIRYATAPQKQIVGEAEIADIIEGNILKVWELTRDHSGITYDSFLEYYRGRGRAIAYRLENIVVYDKPLTLKDLGIAHAPQSFCYIPRLEA